ncbi:MAG: helix-turn-helix transcriptional regulator [Pirellulales bacterium]
MPTPLRLRVANAYFHGEFRRLFRSIVLELGTNRTGREAAVFSLATRLIILARRTAEGQVEDHAACRLSAVFLDSIAELEERFVQPLQISDLADNAGMSYRSYTQKFRRYKGMTVRQYITHLRIEFAKLRMVETCEILGSALESGFGDLGHFYRVFKRHVGCTPQEFICDQTGKTGS